MQIEKEVFLFSGWAKDHINIRNKKKAAWLL